MEQIKDMVTLRQVAMTLATDEMKSIVFATKHYDVNNHLDIAKIIARYIRGTAALPEVYDEKAQIESWKKIIFDAMPKDMQFQWFNPNDIQPKENQQVLVMCKDRKYPLFGEYIGEDYWEVSDADTILQSKFDEVTVVAWLPIPEYNGKTV